MTELLKAANAAEWSPEVRMYWDGGDLVVIVDVPGLREEDLAISVERRVLVIRGARVGTVRPTTAGEHAAAIATDHFCRRVALPFMPRGRVGATLCDGVLEVRVPDARRKRREIPVQYPGPLPGRTPC